MTTGASPGLEGFCDGGVKVPIPCFEERAEGALQAGLKHLGQVRATAETRANQLVAQRIDHTADGIR